MMRGSSCAAALFLTLALAGCAGGKAFQTASGRPETTIPGTTRKEVLNALSNAMLDRGYRLKSTGEQRAVYEKDLKSLFSSIRYGDQINSVVFSRVAFTMVEIGSGVRVVADVTVVSDPGRPTEKETEVNDGRDAVEFQGMLYRLKKDLAK